MGYIPEDDEVTPEQIKSIEEQAKARRQRKAQQESDADSPKVDMPRKTDDRTAVALLESANAIGVVLSIIALLDILGGIVGIVYGIKSGATILTGMGAAAVTFGILLGSMKNYLIAFSKMFCRLVLAVEGKLPKQP